MRSPWRLVCALGCLPCFCAPSLHLATLGIEKRAFLRQEPVGPADRATELYQQAVRLARNQEWVSARARLLKAVELWQAANQHRLAADALVDSADYAKEAGRLQDALEYYLKALGTITLPEEVKEQVCASIAWTYLILNHFDLALRYYRRALESASKRKDLAARALLLTGMAAVYAEMGDAQRGRACLDEAQTIGWDDPIVETRVRRLWLAGHIYRTLGNQEAGRDSLQRALSLAGDSGKLANEQVLMICDLSEIFLSMNQKEQALENARSACRMVESRKLGETKWRSYLTLARVQRALGNKLAAQTSYYRAVADVELRAIGVSADSLKIGFSEERQAPYRELVYLLVEQGRYDEAFKLVEHARSRAMLDLLARKEREPSSLNAAAEITRITTDVGRLHKELHASRAGSEERTRLQSALEEAEIRRGELRIEAQLGRLQGFTKPTNLKELQERTLKVGELLIEFFLGEEHSYVWLVSSSQVTCRILPGKDTIEKRIDPYLKALGDRPSYLHLDRELQRQFVQGREVAQFLFGDLLDNITLDQRLIIVPDGLLYYLPFEALVSEPKGHFLIQDHPIIYYPSASVFALYRGSRSALSASDRLDLLAFGDPITERAPRNSRVNGLAAPMGPYLNALPASKDEVISASHFFPPNKTKVFLGRDATREAFRRAVAVHPRRLHLATHSLIDTVHPSRSGILFSPIDYTDDGLMEIDEVAELDLTDCELVVLSACQTGRGRLTRGEGLVGMARAFLCAGARSVAVSLWKVSDLSTTNLVKRFYRRLGQGDETADALRLAKLEMIETRATWHPFYWAAFVIVGSSS